jgi:hypothetical protein
MDVLLIGGPSDGKRLEMRSLPNIIHDAVFYDADTNAFRRDAGYLTAKQLGTIAAYRRETIRCDGADLTVYVWCEMTMTVAMINLLEGYRVPKLASE